MLVGIFLVALAVGAVFHFAGWGKPLHAATEFLSKWVARAIIVLVGLGIWYALERPL